jgi:hypothetical protein
VNSLLIFHSFEILAVILLRTITMALGLRLLMLPLLNSGANRLMSTATVKSLKQKIRGYFRHDLRPVAPPNQLVMLEPWSRPG